MVLDIPYNALNVLIAGSSGEREREREKEKERKVVNKTNHNWI